MSVALKFRAPHDERMARDASLDDFAAGDDGDESDDAPTADDAEAVAVREPSAVDPAVETSTLASDGAACASCGASVRRLWTGDDERVCADCKSW